MNIHPKCIKNLVLYFCMIIILIFCATILIRFFTKNVLVDKMNICDAFVQTVFYDSNTAFFNELNEKESQSPRIDVNWAKLYPFNSQYSDNFSNENPEESNCLLLSFENAVEKTKGTITNYSCDYLIGYQKIVEAFNKYEASIGWNTAEYNGIVQLSDGYLTSYINKRDISNNISAISSLYNFCIEHGSKFLYVQAPGKLCKYQDGDVSGRLDFSNQNADSLLSGLAKAGIPYIDLRDELHKEYTNHHALFYRTDHHWKGETGLWAALTLSKQLNAQFGYHIPLELLESSTFDVVTYKNWFLGTNGKKITLARTDPEDFNLLYPQYPTHIQYQIQDRNINQTGDFSILYDMEQLAKKDYYNLSPYSAYIHENNALTKIHNNDCSSGENILLIKDSFGNCMAPFLSLGLENLDIIDLRCFTGSIQNYILTEKPEMVIIMYYPDSIKDNIELASHTHLFDFQ